MPQYLITIEGAYESALAALVKESGSTAEDLLQSGAMSSLQSRVDAAVIFDKSLLVDVFDQSPDTDTKAEIYAAYEAAKPK